MSVRDTYDNGGDIEMGRLRVLENRLSELLRENARLRDAMLGNLDVMTLERMAQAQANNIELTASLRLAKEGAEAKATRMQDRVRALQVK